MSEETVRSLLESELATIWGGRTPIVWDNIQATRNHGVSHIEPTIDCVLSETLSKSCQRDTYLFTIVVRVPANKGAAEAISHTDFLKDNFSTTLIGGVTTKTVQARRIGQSNDKTWYSRRVDIELYFNNVKGA